MSIVVYAIVVPGSYAFPGGAGSCASGRDAIANNGPHSSLPNSGGGELTGGNLRVLVNGAELSVGGGVNNRVSVGVDHAIEISGTAGAVFRGFLLRLDGEADTTDYLSTNDNLAKVATSQCVSGQGVGGLTHTSRVDKATVRGVVHVAEPAMYVLDVSVVVSTKYSAWSAAWYFSSFPLEGLLLSGPNVEEPVKSPSNFPSVSTSQLPSFTPTRDPSARPSAEPTDLPTLVTTSTNPTQNPSDVPSSELSSQPTNTKREEPTVQPTSEPSVISSQLATTQPSFHPSIKPSMNLFVTPQTPTLPEGPTPDVNIANASSMPSFNTTTNPSAYPSFLNTSTQPSGQMNEGVRG
jgi:hypothetical protein